MAAWTLEQAREKLTLWLNAMEAVALGQAYEVDTGGTKRKVTHADLNAIQKQVEFWRKEVERLEAGRTGGIKAFFVTPRTDY